MAPKWGQAFGLPPPFQAARRAEARRQPGRAAPRLCRAPTVVCAAALLALIGCSSSSDKKELKAVAAAPDVFQVNLDTSKGPVVIEVHRDWAPFGADHFYTLVKAGYYDGDRFFRVVPGFVVQFGVSGDPATTAKWKDMNLPDGETKQHCGYGDIR